MSDENIIPEGGFDPDDIKNVDPTPEPPSTPESYHDESVVGESAENRIEQDAREVEQAKKKGLSDLTPGSLKSVEKQARRREAEDRLAQDEADIKHDKIRGVNEQYGRKGTQAEIEAGAAKLTHDSEKAAELAAIIAASVFTGGAAAGAAGAAEGTAAAGTAAAGTAAAEGTAAGAAAGAAEAGAAGTAAAGAAEGTAAASGSAEAAAAASRAGASAASSSSAEAAAGAGARTAASEGAASSQGARAASQASSNAAKSSGAVSEEAVGKAAQETGQKAASESASKAAETAKAPGQSISTDVAAERAGAKSAQESAKQVAGDSTAQRKKLIEEAKKKAKEEGKKQAKKHAREVADGTKKKRRQAKSDRQNARYDQQAQAEHNLAVRRSAKYGGAAGAAEAGALTGAGAGAAGDGDPATSMSDQPGDQSVAITTDSRWEKKKGKQANEQAQADKLAQNRAARGEKNKEKMSDKDARKDLLKQEARTRNQDKSGPDHRGRYEKKNDKKQEKTGHNPANIPIVGGIARGRMAVDRKVKGMLSTAAIVAGTSLFMILTMITTTVTTTTGSNQAAQNNQQNAVSGAFIGMSICTPEDTTGGGSEGPGETGPIDPDEESHAKAVYKIFSGMGMPDKNIAGILGNWTQESGVDPTSVQGIFDEKYKIGPKKKSKLSGPGNNYGIGLGQWTADRNTMLREYAKKKNKKWYDMSLQLSFMTDPQGDNASDVAIIKKMISEEQSSPSAAAIHFEKVWERAGKPNVGARTAAAEKWYKKMSSWEEGSGDETDSDTEEPAEEPDDSGDDSSEDSGSSEDTDSGEETTGEAPHWTMPMKDSDYSTSSGYGPRPSPTPGASSWHKGADFAAGDGKPIFAAGDGKVIKSGSASGFGNWIVIDHEYKGEKYSTVYGHMRGNTIKVKTGDKVNAGQQIAAVGSEGFSTGPHLHFEIWEGGRFGGNHVNPVKFLKNVGATDDATGADGPDGPGNDSNEDGGSTGNCSNGLLDWIFGGGGGNDGGEKGKGDETDSGTTDLQNKAIEAGKTQLGVPYSWGGGDLDGPSRGFGRGANTVGFDCSSYVRYAYYQASGGDITMPRTASQQQMWSGMKPIKRDDLQPGDLIYFGLPATHVAMYVGNGKIMHAPSTGDVVKIAQFDGSSYWEGKHKTYRRVPS